MERKTTVFASANRKCARSDCDAADRGTRSRQPSELAVGNCRVTAASAGGSLPRRSSSLSRDGFRASGANFWTPPNRRRGLVLLGLAVLCASLAPPISEAKSIQDSANSLETLEEKSAKLSSTSTTKPSPSTATTDSTTTATATTAPATTEPTETTTSTSYRLADEENDAGPGDDDHDDALCSGVPCDELAEAKNPTDNERLVALQRRLQQQVQVAVKGAARSGLEMFEKVQLSGGCSASLMDLARSLAATKAYAFKFIDASAKVPSGVMHGLLSDFGDFDECLSIRSRRGLAPELEAEERAYSGKYCLLSARLNYHVELAANQSAPDGIQEDGVLWDELVRNYWTSKSAKGFQVGVCLPSRCDNDDIDQLYRYVANKYQVIGELVSCQDSLDIKRQATPDLAQLLIIYSLAALLALAALGTLAERHLARHSVSVSAAPLWLGRQSRAAAPFSSPAAWEGPKFALLEVLLCFSLIRNWRAFMRTHRRPETSVYASHSRPATHRTLSSGGNLSGRSSTESSLVAEGAPDAREQLARQATADRKLLGPLAGLQLLVVVWITLGQTFLYPSANNHQHYRSIIKMNITRDSVWFATTNFTLGIDMILYMAGLVFVCRIAHTTPHLFGLVSPSPASSSSTSSSSMAAAAAAAAASPLALSRRRLVGKMCRRILRFLPVYVTLVALAIVAPLLSDGPMWPEMVSRRLGEACRRNWWANLLMVNNLSHEADICLPSSWFISVLMQLFLAGALIVLAARQLSTWSALALIGTLAGASGAVSFASAYMLRLRAPVIKMDESFVMELDANLFRLYTNFFNNMGPFLVGLAGGLLLVRAQRLASMEAARKSLSRKHLSPATLQRQSQKTVTKILKRLLQRLLAGALVAAIAVAVLSSVFHEHYTRATSALYWSSHRIGWAIVTGYAIHQLATGRWRLLNELLSLPAFVPPSKLIFIAYLVYPVLTHLHSGHVRDGLHVSIYNMMNVYITRLVTTFVAALAIHLLVELPFVALQRLCLRDLWLRRPPSADGPEAGRGLARESSAPVGKEHPLLAVNSSVVLDFSRQVRCAKPEATRRPVTLESTAESVDEDEEEEGEGREKAPPTTAAAAEVATEKPTSLLLSPASND